MRLIDRRDEREELNEKNQRRRKGSHERQSISRTDDEIDERYRPTEEDKDFEQIGDRATTERVSTQVKKNRLEDEPRSDSKKIETPSMQNSTAQHHNCADDGGQVAASRGNDEEAIHRERPV